MILGLRMYPLLLLTRMSKSYLQKNNRSKFPEIQEHTIQGFPNSFKGQGDGKFCRGDFYLVVGI